LTRVAYQPSILEVEKPAYIGDFGGERSIRQADVLLNAERLSFAPGELARYDDLLTGLDLMVEADPFLQAHRPDPFGGKGGLINSRSSHAFPTRVMAILKEHGAGHVPIGVDLITPGHDAYGEGTQDR
jgi:hypothetical protein